MVISPHHTKIKDDAKMMMFHLSYKDLIIIGPTFLVDSRHQKLSPINHNFWLFSNNFSYLDFSTPQKKWNEISFFWGWYFRVLVFCLLVLSSSYHQLPITWNLFVIQVLYLVIKIEICGHCAIPSCPTARFQYGEHRLNIHIIPIIFLDTYPLFYKTMAFFWGDHIV